MATDVRTGYRNILLTRMKFIGDVVLTTPAIRSVRAAFPDAFIAYMGDRHAVSLLEHHPSLNEIIPYDFSRPSAVEQTRVALLLRRHRFDLAIDFFGNPRSALLTFLSGAPTRVGQDRKGRGRLYTIRVRDDGKPKSAVDFHGQLLAAAGIPMIPEMPRIHVTDEEKREADARIRELLSLEGPDARPIIGIHPGATWPSKQWPPERFAALADRISSRLNAHIVLTAGPHDAETITAVLQHAHSHPRPLGVTSLRRLAALLSRWSVFVSNDAGPMHVAASVGTPTVGLFGPGEENIWFPYRREAGHASLRKNVPCHPCHLDFCNREGEEFMECMKLLGIEEVFTEVQRSLRFRPGENSR